MDWFESREKYLLYVLSETITEKKTDQQLANHTSEKRLTNNWLTITLVASFWDDPCPTMGL